MTQISNELHDKVLKTLNAGSGVMYFGALILALGLISGVGVFVEVIRGTGAIDEYLAELLIGLSFIVIGFGLAIGSMVYRLVRVVETLLEKKQ